MTSDRIRSGAIALGLTLTDVAIAQFETLGSELQRWGKKINLTSILDTEEIISSHFLDSLSVLSLIRGPRVIDVGTGAGFPGLPLAIADPLTEFTLLDSHGKKLSFVRHVVNLLGLENVTAVKARVEDYAPGVCFDTVIARALATVPRLIELTAHLVREDGQLLALKGKNPAAELEEIIASPAWEFSVTELTVPFLETHARHVVTLRRTKSTI